MRIWKSCKVEFITVAGKRKRQRVSDYEEHDRRIQVLTVSELRKEIVD